MKADESVERRHVVLRLPPVLLTSCSRLLGTRRPESSMASFELAPTPSNSLFPDPLLEPNPGEAEKMRNYVRHALRGQVAELRMHLGKPSRLQSNRIMKLYFFLVFPVASEICSAQSDYRPGLLFREDWTETREATPITQAHVANPGLILHRYGPGEASIKKSHHDKPADDPYYVWSGPCEANWAVSLARRDGAFDLSKFAKVRWRSKQTGFRELRIIVKLTSGDWFIGDQSDPASADWRIREFNLQDLKWRKLNIETVIEAEAVANVDLSRVAEIGFTDLMRGARSPASSRLDWIEVYGKPVK